MSSILQAFPLTVGTWTTPGPGWMLGIILPAPFWWLFLCPWLGIFISMRLVLSWRLERHLPQTHKASAAGSSLTSSLLPCKSQRRWPPQMHNCLPSAGRPRVSVWLTSPYGTWKLALRSKLDDQRVHFVSVHSLGDHCPVWFTVQYLFCTFSSFSFFSRWESRFCPYF